MAPKCRQMAPRSFQKLSWPLLVALGTLLGRSWPLLAALGWLLARLGPILVPLGAFLGRLARSWGDLRAILAGQGAILGPQGGADWDGGRRHDGAAWAPLETFCESFFLQGT